LARRNVGTPVFGGMILASFVGILAILPLYVMFQAMRERLRPSARPKELQAKSTTVRHVNPVLITVQCMHIRLLRCGSPLVALSGLSETSTRLSAFGAKRTSREAVAVLV